MEVKRKEVDEKWEKKTQQRKNKAGIGILEEGIKRIFKLIKVSLRSLSLRLMRSA